MHTDAYCTSSLSVMWPNRRTQIVFAFPKKRCLYESLSSRTHCKSNRDQQRCSRCLVCVCRLPLNVFYSAVPFDVKRLHCLSAVKMTLHVLVTAVTRSSTGYCLASVPVKLIASRVQSDQVIFCGDLLPRRSSSQKILQRTMLIFFESFQIAFGIAAEVVIAVAGCRVLRLKLLVSKMMRLI